MLSDKFEKLKKEVKKCAGQLTKEYLYAGITKQFDTEELTDAQFLELCKIVRYNNGVKP